MSKIKSIKVKTEFPNSELISLSVLMDLYNQNNHWAVNYITNWGHLYNLEFAVEINLEKPKFLKRPDGSLISEPEEGQEVAFILITKDVNSFVAGSRFCLEKDRFLLRTGKIFLLKDKHLAEKKADMLNKQLEITNEIERLNAEQNWVTDWSDNSQTKCDFSYNHYKKEIEISVCWKTQYGVLFSSEEILIEIQDKYSEDELKQFLGIII